MLRRVQADHRRTEPESYRLNLPEDDHPNGRNPRQTSPGVLRDVHLVPVLFSGWRLCVCVPPANGTASEIARTENQVGKGKVPNVSRRDCRLLAADDRNVYHFLERDAEARLNDHDVLAAGN